MMRKAFTVLFVLASLTITGVGVKSLGSTGSSMAFPSGDYSLTFVPSRERGKLVQVYTVQSEIQKELTVKDVAVKKVGLANVSNKDVAGVRLGWRLLNGEAPSVTMLEGQSRLLHFPFAAGKRLVVTYPLVSLSEIAEPLQKTGQLHGSLAVEVTVEEIVFEDGSRWNRVGTQAASTQSSISIDRVKRVALSAGPRSRPLQDETVPIEEGGEGGAVSNKACAIVPRGGPDWTCVAYNGANCTINGNSCSD